MKAVSFKFLKLHCFQAIAFKCQLAPPYDEVREAGDMLDAMKNCPQGQFRLDALPKDVRSKMSAFDLDNDGYITHRELEEAGAAFAASQRKVRALVRVSIALALFAMFMIIAILVRRCRLTSR